jgi:phospholipase C
MTEHRADSGRTWRIVALWALLITLHPGRAVACVGDCRDTGKVEIGDLIVGVTIALGIRPVTACPAFANPQGKVDIAQLIKAVDNALNGCSGETLTATATPLSSATASGTAVLTVSPQPTPTTAATSPSTPPLDTPSLTATASATPTRTISAAIEHLIVLVQENTSFDAYFGTYCEAPAFSDPTCTDGPSCCEAAPAADPGTGATPLLLDDAEHAAYDPNHLSACEISEINGGLMNRFVAGASCGSNPHNFAYADQSSVAYYRDLVQRSALADRWFQPVTGESSANDMYLARAAFVFADDAFEPTGAIGTQCSLQKHTTLYNDQTIGDLLADAGVPWAFYIQGYQTMADANAQGLCPPADPACPISFPFYPCVYDPDDIPFQYYERFRDNPEFMKDYTHFGEDLAAGNLPAVTFVKAIGFRTEHPGYGETISAGVAFTSDLINRVLSSPYADSTLIVVTYDESGGFFDHVAPPPTSPVDNQPYGSRVPTIAVGRFARAGQVSHVVMEHSSIVKFIEWNWLGGKTGQLGTRDATVNNIGSLLDPAQTGTQVPE